MTTFLEHLGNAMLGTPISTSGNGQSYWPCPACEHRSFHTLPDKPPYPHKFKCHRCGFWGDGCDVVEFVYPGMHRADSSRLVDALRAEYEQKAAQAARPAPPQTPTRPQRAKVADAKCHKCARRMDDPNFVSHDAEYVAVADALETMLGDDIRSVRSEQSGRMLRFAAAALQSVADAGLDPAALAILLRGHEWMHRTDREHLDQCNDPTCDWAICRLLNGWSMEEIREDVERRKEAHLSRNRARRNAESVL